MRKFRIKQVYDRYYIEELKKIERWFKKPVEEWVDINISFFYYGGKINNYPFKDIDVAHFYIDWKHKEWMRKHEKPIYHEEKHELN